jgi:hypothetical protein
LRAFVLATLVMAATTAATTGAAWADASVSGAWRAEMGQGITIDMDVTPDGGWSSETIQHKDVVRRMKGTYTQTTSNDHAGVLVFTPTEAVGKNGKAVKETDRYELRKDGTELRLTTGGDTMVFKKQQK